MSMDRRRFLLTATVDTDSPELLLPVLKRLFSGGALGAGSKDGVFEIRASLQGADAKVLNRELLSVLRRVEKRTRLRAEWKADDGTVVRFFDYVLKKEWKE